MQISPKKCTDAIEIFAQYPEFQSYEHKYQNAFHAAGILFRIGLDRRVDNESEAIENFNDA